MKIGLKFTVINITFGILVILGAIWVSAVLEDTSEHYADLVGETMPKLHALHGMKIAGMRLISSTSEYGFVAAEMEKIDADDVIENTQDDEERQLLEEGMYLLDASLGEYRRVHDKYHGGIDHPEAENKAGFRSFTNEVIVYRDRLVEISAKILAEKMRGVSGAPILQLKDDFEEIELDFLAVVDKEIRRVNAKLASDITIMDENIALSELSAIMIAILLLLFSLLVAWYQSRAFVYPVVRFSRATDIFSSKGDIARDDLCYRANNELGQLADSLLAMMESERSMTEDLKRAMADAESANMQKSEFLANMSHELRTPMHAVLNFSSMGLKKLGSVSDEKLEMYFSSINQSGSRLLMLLNDLLDISKLEAGKMSYNMASNDFHTLLEQARTELSSLLKEKFMRLEIDYRSTDAVAFYDHDRILQVAVNLLSNAIKFSPENTVITVSVYDATLSLFDDGARSDSAALAFSVADEGVGLPADELETVFDKFVQSRKTKTGGGGTGLGLAICKEIVHGHHGKIYAENAADRGSIFTVVIPRYNTFSH